MAGEQTGTTLIPNYLDRISWPEFILDEFVGCWIAGVPTETTKAHALFVPWKWTIFEELEKKTTNAVARVLGRQNWEILPGLAWWQYVESRAGEA